MKNIIIVYYHSKCYGQPIADIPPNTNTTIQISTKYPSRIYYNDTGAAKPYIWCVTSYSFREHGRYGWNITKNGCSSLYTLFEPWSPYLRKYFLLLKNLCILFMIYYISLLLL